MFFKFKSLLLSIRRLNNSHSVCFFSKFSVRNTSGLINDLFQRLYFFSYDGCKIRHPLMQLPITQLSVLMEFSSPNVAKPLHAGHLRSTVIGNVLSNIYTAAGHKLLRVNFIGDCGTQFAIIGAALTEDEILKLQKQNDVDSHEIVMWLMKTYIEQSSRTTQKHEKPSSSQLMEKEKINTWHNNFEINESNTRRIWEAIRHHSLRDLMSIYKRLHIDFDKYEYESDYISKARELANEHLTGITSKRTETGCFSIVSQEKKDSTQSRSHVFLKSDGSSVYLSRDVAALLTRIDRSKKCDETFDSVHYVVENGQSDHLELVRKIVCTLRPSDAEALNPETFHVKFGRIHGMSTRKGSIVLLGDILDEARTRMRAILVKKSTTKIDKSDKKALDDVAEKLGVSAVVVNCLKRRRQGDYKFNWESTLNFGADGGIFLQYTHARLCSIEANAVLAHDKIDLLQDFDCLLSSEAACNVLDHMLRFEEVVNDCLTYLETSPFVLYSLKLARLANKCVEDPVLRVKDQPPSVVEPRLVLFRSTRHLLASCLNILGLPALKRV